MSRSNPISTNPNPSTKFYEWKGGQGKLSFFDKEKKEQVEVPLPFRCLVLDQLSTVGGYNKKAKSGIFANEVRDSREEALTVKLFTGEVIAEGFWKDIKEKVSYSKGSFAASCYVAYKDGSELRIGNIRFSGCSLGPWFDFIGKNRKGVDTKALVIDRGDEDTSGSVDFFPPKFSLQDTSPETDEAAKALDKELQEYLEGYFKRNRHEKVATPESSEEPPLEQREEPTFSNDDDDSITF
jgi:hypothetical protein